MPFLRGSYYYSYGREQKELDSVCETVETIGKRNSCTIDTHYLKQREALNTALPIGVRQVETMRTLLTQSLAVLMPFNVQELNDSTGNYYGINQISKNVNIGNRKKLINGNGFVSECRVPVNPSSVRWKWAAYSCREMMR